MSEEKEMINHPEHYNQGGIEAIDAMAAACVNLNGMESVCISNAIKYLFRWKHKNGIEDLKKAIWYVNHLVEYLGQNK